MRFPQSNTGKVYDPVFLFMLGAVILAIGSSFALRAMVGPASARAAEQTPDATADQSPAVDRLPPPPKLDHLLKASPEAHH